MIVIMRDAVMPDCCNTCVCSEWYGCGITGTVMTTKEMEERPDWCPLEEQEPCEDTISRQAAVDAIYHHLPSVSRTRARTMLHEVPSAQPERIPAADVAPLVHGKWLPIVSYNNTYKCSECGRLLVNIADGLKTVAKHYPYCHCGAKMDGEE